MEEQDIIVSYNQISGVNNPLLNFRGMILSDDVTIKIYASDQLIKEERYYHKQRYLFDIKVLLNDQQKNIKINIVTKEKEYCLCQLKNAKIRRLIFKLKNLNKTLNRPLNLSDAKEYSKYFARHSHYNYKKMKYNPCISLLVPVYNTESKYLIECLDSVLNQRYQNFEICIVDDCSTNAETLKVLKEYQAKDQRIKLLHRKTNGHIALATNDALAMAEGEFVGFLDSDDLLTENALYEVVYALNKNANLDFIYSDEDKATINGEFLESYFKPNYAPDTFMNCNYICHFTVIRTNLVKKMGGFRKKYVGAQDFDLFLRITEQISYNHIYHIEKVLYHWRKVPGSTASHISCKSYAIENGKKAVLAALKRRHLTGEISELFGTSNYLLQYTYKKEPSVSLIVYNADNNNIRRCLDSINKLSYQKKDIIVVSNNVSNDIKEQLCDYHDLELLTIDDTIVNSFNNIVLTRCRGDYIFFLDSNLEIIDSSFLTDMVAFAKLKHIGAVGCRIMDKNNITKSSGMVYIDGNVRPRFEGFRAGDRIYWGYNCFPTNCSIVPINCLLINKAKFTEIAGFDKHFKKSYYDADLCLRLLKKGYYNITLAHKEIIYHKNSNECKNNNRTMVNDHKYFKKKWPKKKTRDPFYNSNLSHKRLFYLDNK